MIKELLTHKGWLTTILGIILGLFTIIIGLLLFAKNKQLENQQLITYSVFMTTAFIAVILPSEVEITTKFGSMKIKD